jgi:hypothetical protein
LRPSQLTQGLEQLTIACASVIELGPNDYAIFYDTTNTQVLAGVASINVTPLATSGSGATFQGSMAPQGLDASSASGH